MKNIIKFEDYKIDEEVAASTGGNTGGMGNVVAPIVGTTVANSVAGSGDLPAYDNTVNFKTNIKKEKKKKKKVCSFNEWTKK